MLSVLLASCATLISQPATRAQAPAASLDSKVVLSQARAAYYDLSARGFRQYRFQAKPDWAAMLGELATTNPDGFAGAMKLFATLHFDVVVAEDGTAKVSHNEVESPNEKARAGMDQVYNGMDQMLTGFFQTWSPFMVQTPFTKVGTGLSIEETGGKYRVQWVESGSTKVDILMDRTYAVTEMKVSSPTFDSVIRPTFDRQPGGLVLVGYEADYKEKAPAEPIRVLVLIKNKPVQGLMVPTDLDLTAWIGTNKTRILMAFTAGSVEKK